MNPFQFKQLDIKPEDNRVIRTLKSAHFKKTILAAVIGAVFGYAMFYLSLPSDSHVLWNDEALSNMIFGLGFGIFITNSPCSRGRC